MLTLPNLYTSDMRDILDWFTARNEGAIPSSLNARVENALKRLEKDLHDIAKGKK